MESREEAPVPSAAKTDSGCAYRNASSGYFPTVPTGWEHPHGGHHPDSPAYTPTSPDIGVFRAEEAALGGAVLNALDTSLAAAASPAAASAAVARAAGAAPGATFQSGLQSGVGAEARARLVALVDEQWDGVEEDLKVRLSADRVHAIVGGDATERMAMLAKKAPDALEWIVRRCCAYGKSIHFHTDHALRTLNVALNSEEQYVGGRLVFALDDGFRVPPRPAGSATLHSRGVAHGVTRLGAGVRYSLVAY